MKILLSVMMIFAGALLGPNISAVSLKDKIAKIQSAMAATNHQALKVYEKKNAESDGAETFYVNDANQVLKYVGSEMADCSHRTIIYFAENGNAIFQSHSMQCGQGLGPEGEHRDVTYFENGVPIESKSYFNKIGSSAQKEVKSEIENNDKLNLNSFLEKQQSPIDFSKLKYAPRKQIPFPQKVNAKETQNLKTFAVNVILRDGPSANDKKVQALPLHQVLTLKEIGPEEDISPWGKHRWYRIETADSKNKAKGWVFGVFLEPH